MRNIVQCTQTQKQKLKFQSIRKNEEKLSDCMCEKQIERETDRQTETEAERCILRGRKRERESEKGRESHNERVR